MRKSMKPYYEHNGIVIYHGDCRDVLPTLDAGSVDIVLTDPPYGVGMNSFDDDFNSTENLNIAPGNIGCVFTSPRRIVELANKLVSTWKYERTLWMHKKADIAAPWRAWCMNGEAICIFSRSWDDWKKPDRYFADTFSIGPWERAGHPNGKPLAVVRKLVQSLAREDQCILDPFMGSGTTLRAAKDNRCHAIGIEIEERYCEIAAKRLAQDVFQFEEQSA